MGLRSKPSSVEAHQSLLFEPGDLQRVQCRKLLNAILTIGGETMNQPSLHHSREKTR